MKRRHLRAVWVNEPNRRAIYIGKTVDQRIEEEILFGSYGMTGMYEAVTGRMKTSHRWAIQDQPM